MSRISIPTGMNKIFFMACKANEVEMEVTTGTKDVPRAPNVE